MNEQLIVLEAILPNPWQPRESEDLEHIKSLALDIAAHGLLQTPVGRMVDNGQSVQLAFGHSRLAAFKWLSDVQINSNLEGDWHAMPVIIQELTDEQMFEMALSENLQRRDLTPIEVARAMARYRSEFGKTSPEIGKLFGISDSAVRNKIRLLELPEDLQKGLAENGVSERTGRELLALFDLPEDLRKMAEERVYTSNRPSIIIRRALKGAPSEEIANAIRDMMQSIGTRMSNSLFKHDQAFEGDYRSPTCKDCPLRTIIQDDAWCVDKACFSRKQDHVKIEYLTQASLICGIPVDDKLLENNWQNHRFYGADGRRMMEIGCENLRLTWADRERDGMDGYPHAEIMCQKSSAHCVCKRALDSGVLKAPAPAAEITEKWMPPTGKTLVEVFGHEPIETETVPDAPKIEPAAPKPLTAEDLKEIDRELRRKKRQDLEECKAIRSDAAQKIYFALIEHNPAIWMEVTKNFISFQKRENLHDAQFEELVLLIAEKIAVNQYDWQYNPNPSPKFAISRFNELFKLAGLPEIVSAETVQGGDVPPESRE